MAENNSQKDVYSANDPFDINELASLNDDISTEFIEQLQSQLTQNVTDLNGSADAALFEEVSTSSESVVEKYNKPIKVNFDDSFDDNFIKKYKAKLNKQQLANAKEEASQTNATPQGESAQAIDIPTSENSVAEIPTKEDAAREKSKNKEVEPTVQVADKEIEKLSSGNIVEKPLSKEQLDYNDSLDFLDNNTKYSKYVIYIDPENTEFIESLTVKERKNLINKILREQDDITITKRRLSTIQTVVKHSIVAIITFAIAVPVIYFTINASLEASINNYRRSQTIFQTLYREKGKIKTSTMR